MRNAVGAVESLLVLGGTSEIALATARCLVEQGCRRVILACRDVDGGKAAGQVLADLGAEQVDVVAFDADRPATHGEVIDEAFADGDVDLVLMAFGVLGDQEHFDDDPVAAADAVTTNYTGAVSSGLAVAGHLRAQGHGTLVVLSSVAGERARQTNYVYGSSKAGLDSFAQGLGDSLVGDGVDVMIVRPGFVRSRMTAGMEAQPFATTPDAVALAVQQGLARRRSVVWVPGVLRWVFMIMRHLPRPVWRRISAR